MPRGPRRPADDTSTTGVGEPVAGGDVLMIVGAGHLSTHRLERPLVIGRGADCDVVIDSRNLSRRHVRVDPGPPITVRDLDSTNGTVVGGTTVRGGPPVALAPGDGFRIGGLSFVLVAGGPTGPSLSASPTLRVLDPTPTGLSSLVRDVARSTVSVLILGETGVGKEVLAESLHGASGRPGPIVRINCAALSESLLSSELFGHEAGAFTGAGARKLGLLESAQQGTVFLDEIGDMPLSVQATLLRAVEQREVVRVGGTRPTRIDVRFVAATNRDLGADVVAGRFRRDLYFRLDGVALTIPPLRERRGQIGALALGFLAPQAGAPTASLTAEALAILEDHPWPGNVRELKAVVERARLLARGGPIQPRHLALTPAPAAVPPASVPPAAVVDDEPGPSDPDDRARVLAALEACAGNQTRAARQLGISRTTLVSKLLRYQIRRPRS